MSRSSVSSSVSSRRPRELRRALTSWYGREARDLPWRRTRDPYAVWLSETMLQQTRVETVIPYWNRFLAELPTFAALAEAEEERVLSLWSGLGYYRRARALRAAAERIVAEHGGRFPADPAAARALPGVGRYTAGAVLSIAYDLPVAAVDGNVVRVLARLFALDPPEGRGALEREVWRRAQELVPRRGAGRWNQALMELGATVCLPREPGCGCCPLASACAARSAGRQEALPRPARRPEPVEVEVEVALARRGALVLLELRPPEGRMAGLWQLPTRETGRSAGPLGGLFPASFPRATGGRALLRPGPVLGHVRHAITRHRVRATVFAARAASGAGGSGGLAWHAREDLAALPLTGMARKILRAGFAR